MHCKCIFLQWHRKKRYKQFSFKFAEFKGYALEVWGCKYFNLNNLGEKYPENQAAKKSLYKKDREFFPRSAKQMLLILYVFCVLLRTSFFPWYLRSVWVLKFPVLNDLFILYKLKKKAKADFRRILILSIYKAFLTRKIFFKFISVVAIYSVWFFLS